LHIDGLKGFEKAIGTVFPQTEIQRCIVHQVRYSCKFVNYKDRKLFCKDMKWIYAAATEEGGLEQLKKFEERNLNKHGGGSIVMLLRVGRATGLHCQHFSSIQKKSEN